MDTLISIVTINYNNRTDTFRFLRSIEKLRIQNIEVIVVDNGSKENISQVMETYFPWVKLVRSERNLGFAGGNNLGMAAANGAFLYFVNNDTIFLEDHLQVLAGHLADHPKMGAISPQLVYPDGRVQFQGRSRMNPITGRTRDLKFDRKGLAPTAFIHGGAVMISRKVLEEVGLMPEHYFLYYEELAWAEQIKSAGYELYVDLDSEIVHDESATTSQISDLKTYFMTRNRLMFMRNHASASFLLFMCYFLVFALPGSLWNYLKNKEFGNIRASWAATLWHLTHGRESRQLGYKFDHLTV